MPAHIHATQDSETVTLVIQGKTASIKDYHWTSESAPLAMLLNARLSASGPSGADPHPSLTAAKQAAADLGGSIVSEGQSVFDPELVY